WRFQGLNVDFENIAPGDEPLLLAFLQRLHAGFAPYGLSVSTDLEANDTGRRVDWKAVAQTCDFVVVMAYDENTRNPGPISSIEWFRTVLQRAVERVPREKLVMGIANYAYDWTEGNDWAEPLTYQAALLRAREYSPETPVEKLIDFDPVALNPTFSYFNDEENREHQVWMLDGVTAANEWMIAQKQGIRGAALWVLGSADPSIWSFLRRDRLMQPVNPGLLHAINYRYDVEFVGDGEILHVTDESKPGARNIEVDSQTGLILDESMEKIPTSNVITRTG